MPVPKQGKAKHCIRHTHIRTYGHLTKVFGTYLRRGLKVRVGSKLGNTFSTKMLFRSVLVVTGLIYNIEAIGPVVSNNEWTPVVNSQRVYLSPEVLAKYRQQDLQETQSLAEER